MYISQIIHVDMTGGDGKDKTIEIANNFYIFCPVDMFCLGQLCSLQPSFAAWLQADL